MSTDFSTHSVHKQFAAPIIGRTREQEILRTRLLAALAGHGSLVLIGGEAGIGKSALADWLEDVARAEGADVLEGHCYDLTMTPPYGPWLDAFEDVNLEDRQSSTYHPLQMPTDPGSITSQSLLIDQVRTFLASMTATRPVMLVLEDLHWSDPASLELLRHLARAIDSLGLLLIATYRVDEITRKHPLFQLLPHLIRESQAERIDLRTLDNDDAHAFVKRRYALAPDDETRLVAYLQSLAEGNPLYLTELLRTLETERLLQSTADRWIVGELNHAPVPPLVRQIIEGRLAKLDDATRLLLEIAAVIGQDVPLDVWLMANDADDEQHAREVEEAINAHLILETPGTASVHFSHALVRETLYHGQSLPRRQMLHRHVAEILVSRADPPISVVASHFSQADDPRAVDWLVRAGERALALYAANDAVAALTRAQELAGRYGEDLPLAAYRARASAFAMLGEFDQARRDHEVALERGRATGAHRDEWQALVDLGMLWAERDYERTGEYYREALNLARSIGDKPMIAYSLNRIANWHVNLDEPGVALPLHQEALAIFEASDDRHGVAGTLDFLGMANFLNGDWSASTRYLERAIGLLRDLGDRQRLSSSLSTINVNGGTLDRDVSAAVYREVTFWFRVGEEGLEIAHEIGWTAGEAYALIGLSLVAGVRGDFGRALRDGEAALAIAERIEHRQWMVFSRYILGATWKELLDDQRAEAELAQTLAAARMSGSQIWITVLTAILATMRIEVGELDRAAAMLGTVVRHDDPRPSMIQRQCWFVQARLELARGDPDRALAIVDRLGSLNERVAPGRGVPQLMKLRGDVLARLHRYDEAEQTYQAARDGAELFGFSPYLWRIDAARGELYQEIGRTADAATACRDARATIEKIAESIEDQDIRERFQSRAFDRLPVLRTIDRRSASQTGLSAREMEVLRLVAEGKSDREIAETLFISPRTVNRHVTAILNKIGVNTRTSATAFAIRQGLV